MLLQYLIDTNPTMSRSRLKQLLHDGRILVNGKPVTRYNHSLSPSDKVEIAQKQSFVSNRQSSIVNRQLSIVYEDPYLVVIDKREGILSMATSHHSFCVKTVLDDYFDHTRQRCHAHVVHRLDRDTSGLLIYAKSREVQQLFEADWKGLVYDRRYVAVAIGHLEQDEGTVQSWLSPSRQYFTQSSPVDNGGKLAITHYRVLERGQINTLVEARLDTGRKNQIRVHLSDLGHPVLGDRKYGPEPEAEPASALRLYLHAYRLHFIHPVTGERLQFDTPIPQPFLQAL